MKKKYIILFFFSLVLISCRQKPELSLVEKGRSLYTVHCAPCHGETGDQGPLAQYLSPKPRPFAQGTFKYRTTRGPVPSDYDILQIFKMGIPGTPMPGWDILKSKDWQAILAYFKTLTPNLKEGVPGPRIDIPDAPPSTPESIQAGLKLYQRTGCVACHGVEGRADGLAAVHLKDVWGNPILPRDLTQGPFKWGNIPKELFATLSVGIAGTPMPGYEQTLSASERWQLVSYLKSIQRMPKDYDPSHPQRFLIRVSKVNGDIPPDPQQGDWEKIKAVPVFLKPLWSDKDSPEWLMVKALHNGREIAFYFSWEDSEANTKPTLSDAVAIQFPLKEISDPSELPFLGLGSPQNPVQVWLWNTQESRQGTASGVGTLKFQTPSSTQEVKGTYQQGKWHVVFKRPLKTDEKQDIHFGKTGYLSFAVWDANLSKNPRYESFSEWMIYEIEGL